MGLEEEEKMTIPYVTIYQWPDGTWCYEEDLEEYLTWMSDDYEIIRISNEDYL